MYEYLLPGLLLGISAGFSPGPLMTLVISQTLKHGLGEGVKIAIAPFITDIPIIFLIIAALFFFKDIKIFLVAISFLGAA